MGCEIKISFLKTKEAKIKNPAKCNSVKVFLNLISKSTKNEIQKNRSKFSFLNSVFRKKNFTETEKSKA